MSGTTNRLTDPGYSYDANGNMTNDGLNGLTYDAENRVVTSSGTSYSYDGNSLRVKKLSGGTTTVYVFSGTKVITEYVNGAAPASPTREYIYSGSGLLATIEGGTTKYHHSDHLSPRVTNDSSGALIGQQAHYPYGESWYAVSTTTKWQFTSYERDTESGNDYAQGRCYVNRLGRFSSPDPLGGSLWNPQSLNLYAYLAGDPINGTDPYGLATCQGPPCDNRGGGGGCMVASCGSSGLEFAVYYLNGVEVSAEQAARFLGSGQAVVCSDCRGGGTTGPQTQISITWNEWGNVISRLCMDADLTACYPPEVAHYIQITIIETTIVEESTASWFSDFGSNGENNPIIFAGLGRGYSRFNGPWKTTGPPVKLDPTQLNSKVIQEWLEGAGKRNTWWEAAAAVFRNLNKLFGGGGSVTAPFMICPNWGCSMIPTAPAGGNL